MIETMRRVALAVLMAAATVAPASAGDSQVVHVGQTTTLHLDGGGWKLDRAASRQAHLVAVQGGGSSGAQRFVVRGLKTGQTVLTFRSGQKTYQAYIDVLR